MTSLSKTAAVAQQRGERSPDSVYFQREEMVDYEATDDENASESSSRDGSDALRPLDAESERTGNFASGGEGRVSDATESVHEMHLALLYLLSHPEEFQRAIEECPPQGTTSLDEWNHEYERDSVASTSAYTDNNSGSCAAKGSPPLPFVVFSDDAEVVLPQAHTVSQLFGLEVDEGIELEAAAGIQCISQLFVRWLALMPGGDHLNLIDPPGLTVMRIAGGRYRVTAAHRVVWTWMNCIAGNPLQPGDLVTMTIVDVFETDSQGRLLSYCPTFDNREVHKTHATTETLRKSSMRLVTALQKAHKSKLGRQLLHKATGVANMAKSVHLHIASRSNTGSSSRQVDSYGASMVIPDDSERHEV